LLKPTDNVMNGIQRLSAGVLCIVLAFSIVPVVSLGCSMMKLPEPPRSIVAPNMYIFVGEVTGYTEPVTDPANFRGEAVGLTFRVVDAIHIPFNFHYPNIEVFMFRHGSDCFPEAKTDIRKVPIGSKYWFAIYPAKLVSGTSSGTRSVRLETDAFSMFGFWTETPEYTVNSTSEFDYKGGIKELMGKKELQERIPGPFDLLFIETSKDLLRLAKVKTEVERLKVLERLLYDPYVNYFRLFQSEVRKPLTSEHNPYSVLTALGTSPVTPYSKRYSKAERKLIAERIRIEKSGELKLF
jgi:hypothetical protein